LARRRNLIGAAASGVAAVAVLSGPPAAADYRPTIAVTPHEGLGDGQVVRVDGKGWPDPAYDFQDFGVVQCTGTTLDQNQCGNAKGIPESAISPAGSYAVDYVVRRSFRNDNGTATIDCTPPAQCNVVAFVFITPPEGPAGVYTATAPITFAAPK
jgi:hypothetical protein